MKTITVTDEAYEKLKKMKSENESFTDTILKLPEKNVTARDFLGLLEGGDIKEDRKRLKKLKEQFDKDAEERLRALHSR